MLGHRCTWLSLVVSGSYSLAAGLGLLAATASLLVELGR